MIRVTALYPNTPGSRFDWKYYMDSHCPMAKAELAPLGLTDMKVDRVLSGGMGDPPAFHAIASLTFGSMAEFQNAMQTAAPKLLADIPNYTDVSLQLQVSEAAL